MLTHKDKLFIGDMEVILRLNILCGYPSIGWANIMKQFRSIYGNETVEVRERILMRLWEMRVIVLHSLP